MTRTYRPSPQLNSPELSRQRPTSQQSASPARVKYHSPASTKSSPHILHQSSGDTVLISSGTIRHALTSWDRFRAMAPASAVEHDVTAADLGSVVPVASLKAKKMIQCVRNLKHLGIDYAIKDIPSICVIGDQSVGKSSLIEAISGIRVPRSAGCCTRCPLEINMTNTYEDNVHASSGKGWSCRIFLMKSFYYEASKNKSAPWRPQEIEEIPFAMTDDTYALCDLIARAQSAILNPGMDHRVFLDESRFDPSQSQNLQAKFSPNVIRLDIYSDQVCDLSLFDLPGIISVPDNEDEGYLVGLVDKLVKSYIQQKASINLLCLPMNNDFANSKAANIIQRHGDKKRTIGVLTKPDLYQRTESFQQWLDILQGRKFTFGNGYFVVCNAADVQVNHAAARQKEFEFFSGEPWNLEPLSRLSTRFGTHNLAAELQRLLEQQIRLNLPVIQDRIGNVIMEKEAQLAQLPPRLHISAYLVVAQYLSNFKQNVSNLFTAASPTNYFLKSWREIAENLREVLEDSKPKMFRRTRTEEAALRRLGRFTTPQTPNSQTEGGSGTPQVVDLDAEHEGDARPGSRRRRDAPWDNIRQLNKHFYLDRDVRPALFQYASSIPNSNDPRAVEHMFRQSISHWQEALDMFHHLISRLILDNVKQLVYRTFGPNSQDSKLCKVVMIKVDELVTSMIDMQQHKGRELLEIEIRVPYTTNRDEMIRQETLTFEKLFKARRDVRLEDLNTLDNSPRKVKVKEEALPKDDYEREIAMFSKMRAYYSIASSRFCDNVCQGVQAVLFSKCLNGLCTELDDLFKLGTKEGEDLCEELLTEEPDVIQARARLEREIQRFEEAKVEIESIYSHHGEDEDMYGAV